MEFSKDSVFNQKYNFESDVIDIQRYFKDYSRLLQPVLKCQEKNCDPVEGVQCGKEDCKNDEFYKSFLGISKGELEELKQRTSVDLLTCEGEIQPVSHAFYKKFNEENLKSKSKPDRNNIETLVSLKSDNEVVDAKTKHIRTFYKYCNYQWCIVNEKPNNNELNFNTEDFSSVIFCVKVYYPFLSSRNKMLKLKLLQEVHILGSQTLSQLRDKIICSLDFISDKDESNDCLIPPDVVLEIKAKDEYPSSFIFIEDTFYNDTRSDKLVDLSKEIREWSLKRSLGPFKSSSMEKTRMCDLNLKIGRPYVFQHQGNCEHLIVISDIRLLDLNDPPQKFYPRIHCTGRVYGKHCMMCSDSYARWLVVGNERLTHNKTYLCKKCFFSYNYVNGQKVGEFKAFKYTDVVALL